MLPASSPEDEQPSRLASFVVPNYGGQFTAGERVTVVVAGLAQQGLVIEDAVPASASDGAAAPADAAAPSEPGSAPEMKLLSLKTTANGDLLDVRFRMKGVERLPPGGADTYVMDPETGVRYTPLGVTRIGMLSTKHLDKAGTSFLILKKSGDAEGVIRPGQKVTVVIAGVRQDGVLVEEN
jgi:hypothetical protein